MAKDIYHLFIINICRLVYNKVQIAKTFNYNLNIILDFIISLIKY